MSQPTVAAYFNTRKRVAADELSAATRSKVLVLEHSTSGAGSEDGRELHSPSRVVFANTKNFLSKNVAADGIDSCSVGTPERKKITRATRSIKRIGAVKVGETKLEQSKLVRFLKMGNLSPKKACTAPQQANTPTKAEFSAKNNTGNVERGLHTPTKQQPPAVNPARAAVPSAVSKLTMEETKGKLSRSVRLAELKTSLNKLQGGFDRLDRLEKTRQEDNWKPPVPPSPTTAARNLKQFEKFEVEVPVR